MHSCEWDPNNADLAIFNDACPDGMAFWVPSLHLAFQHIISAPPEQIFFFEVLTIVSALHWFVDNLPVHTDNLNTVDMFNTF